MILVYLFAFSLNYLWGLLNGVAMIAYLPLINVNFPANFMLVLEKVIKFVTFDIFPEIDAINDLLFTTHYSEGELQDRAVGFDLLDFGSHNYAKNTGSMWVFIAWMICSGLFFKWIRGFAENHLCIRFY